MNYQETYHKIEKIEQELGGLINSCLKFCNVSDEKFIIVSIVNDSVDLLIELQRNIYAFFMSYGHEENIIEFRPNYYFENIVLQYDMIWERIVLLVGVLDGIDEQIIFDRNSIEPLYDLVKKIHPETDEFGCLLRKIKGESSNKKVKINRNNNEHYISSHLNDDSSVDVDMNHLFELHQTKIKMNLSEWKKVSDELDLYSKEKMKGYVDFIDRIQSVYIDLFRKIIPLLGKQFGIVSMKSYKRLIVGYPAVNDSFFERAYELDRKYVLLREKYSSVIEKVNRNVLFCNEKDVTIRYTLLIDALYRAKELTRSINLIFCILNYRQDPPIVLFDFSEEEFKEYLCNDIFTENIYLFHLITKTYSVFEKTAKFLLSKNDLSKDYFDDEDFKRLYVVDIVSKLSNATIKTPSVNKFCELVSSTDYKFYERLRNVEYHCLRQEYLYFENSWEVYIGKMHIILVLLERLFPILNLLVDEESLIVDMALEM